MSERERANFLEAAVSRAPGKRQIKPNAALFEVETGTLDDDEDDEDFQANDEEESSSDGNSSDNFSNSDEERNDDDQKNASDDDGSPFDDEIVNLHNVAAGASVDESEPLICSVCLNTRAVTKGAEVIQCDRCGLAVHEACYAVEELADDASVTSSVSTEPWFCEPCTFGLSTIPHCELCPSQLGAFKKTNVDGCWVHLLCALYTPGMSFGDTDHLTAASWQEMDFRSFGRKACIACTNKLDARTGVAVQCEAGLCKNYLHVTCAQKLGLLMDGDSEDHHHGLSSPTHNDFNFLLCKRHNHSESVRIKREAYLKFTKQEAKRMVLLSRSLLNSRQECKRRKQLQRYLERMKRIENFVIVAPSTSKRTRMLHNNSRLLNSFREKAELIGVDAEKFESVFFLQPAEQIPSIPPTLSLAFVNYFKNREKIVFNEEGERLEYAKNEKLNAQLQLKNFEGGLKLLQEKASKLREQRLCSIALLNRFCDTLSVLNVPKKHYTSAVMHALSPMQPKSSLSPKVSSPRQKNDFASTSDSTNLLPATANAGTRGRKRSTLAKENESPRRSRKQRVNCKLTDRLASVDNDNTVSSETVKNFTGKRRKTIDSSSKAVVVERRGRKKKTSLLSSTPIAASSVANCGEPSSILSVVKLSPKSLASNGFISPTKLASIKRPNILSRSNSKVLPVINANVSVKLNSVSTSTPLRIKIPSSSSTAANSPVMVSPNNSTQKKIKLSPSSKLSPNHVGFASAAPLFSMQKYTTPHASQWTPTSKSNMRFNCQQEFSTSESDATAALMLLFKNHCDSNGSRASASVPEAVLHTCFTCSKMNNQELLVYCDTCKHHYHLGCLDPPLKKMPPKRKNFAFQCSDCACPSSDSEVESELKRNNTADSDSTLLSTRQRRSNTGQRLSFDSLLMSLVTTASSMKRKKKKTKKGISSGQRQQYHRLNDKAPVAATITPPKKILGSTLKKKIAIMKRSAAKLATTTAAATVGRRKSYDSDLAQSSRTMETHAESSVLNGNASDDNGICGGSSPTASSSKRSRKQLIALTPSPNFSTLPKIVSRNEISPPSTFSPTKSARDYQIKSNHNNGCESYDNSNAISNNYNNKKFLIDQHHYNQDRHAHYNSF